MDLKDKVAVITGGTKGLGKALAIRLIAEGAQVTISSRSTEELEKVSSEIGATACHADVTSLKDLLLLREFTVKRFGRIDLWVNNAGTWLPYTAIEDLNWDKVHAMFETNVFGTMYGSKAAMQQMKRQNSGTIINILSTSALEGRPFSSAYCATKFAADGFTKSLRLEVKDTGIKVLAMYPPGMKTDMIKAHPKYGTFVEPSAVAEKIVANLKKEDPIEELILKD